MRGDDNQLHFPGEARTGGSLLLQIFYSVRSERMLIEQLQ
jgi:hypothetical protein